MVLEWAGSIRIFWLLQSMRTASYGFLIEAYRMQQIDVQRCFSDWPVPPAIVIPECHLNSGAVRL